MKWDKKQQEAAQQAAQQAAEDKRAADTELALRVAHSTPAPGQELTPEAQQLKDAAADMLDSTNDPSFVAGYVQRKLAQTEQTRKQQRGGGRG